MPLTVHFRRPMLPAFAAIAFATMLAACNDADKAAATAPNKVASESEPDKGKPLQLSAEDARRAGLKVERIRYAKMPETVAVFGTVEPNKTLLVRVSSPVAGRLVRIAANLGDRVEAAATLAILESPELGAARAAYQQAKAEFDLAKANRERTQRLVAGDLIAQKEELRAQTDYYKAQAAFDAAGARLTNLGVTATAPPGIPPTSLAIKAPFAGIVIEKSAALGEYAEAYKPFFTIADLSSVWIETNLYERDLGRVTVGVTATITVAGYPKEHLTGKLTYVSNMLDGETHTAKARIEVANLEGKLKPGMFANVTIDTTTRRPVLSVPETAIVLLQGQMTAFVQKGAGFEPRPVETGERINDQIVVKSGLMPGDEVVVEGAYALKSRLLRSQISAD